MGPDVTYSIANLGLISASVEQDESDAIYVEVFTSPAGNPVTSTVLKRCFEETLGSYLIPYSMEERQRRFSAAFESLSKYIEAHRKAQELRSRKTVPFQRTEESRED